MGLRPSDRSDSAILVSISFPKFFLQVLQFKSQLASGNAGLRDSCSVAKFRSVESVTSSVRFVADRVEVGPDGLGRVLEIQESLELRMVFVSACSSP